MMEWFSQENLDIVLRLSVAVLLGAIIGLEREVARKYAGLRTYVLVSLGAALFATMSETTMRFFWEYLGGTPNFDPTRIISNIVVGVGFLGAGMVIFHREKVLGLTTAAGVWVTAAIGASVGIGAYVPAIAATLLVLFTLVVLRRVELWLQLIGNEKLTRLTAEKEDDGA